MQVSGEKLVCDEQCCVVNTELTCRYWKSEQPAGESVAIVSCPCCEAYIMVEPYFETKQMYDCWASELLLESDRTWR